MSRNSFGGAKIGLIVGIATCFGALLVAILLLAIAPAEPKRAPTVPVPVSGR